MLAAARLSHDCPLPSRMCICGRAHVCLEQSAVLPKG